MILGLKGFDAFLLCLRCFSEVLILRLKRLDARSLFTDGLLHAGHFLKLLLSIQVELQKPLPAVLGKVKKQSLGFGLSVQYVRTQQHRQDFRFQTPFERHN